MSDTHTIELESQEAKWLLDGIRWSKERANERNLNRNKRRLEKLENELRDQLPGYETLAKDI